MPRMIGSGLSRREREIIDVLYKLGKATAMDVMNEMPDPPSYSAVRSILRILEEKGHIQHEEDGKRYLYLPTQPQQTAAKSAIQQVIQTFFGGSIEQAVKTFISDKDTNISEDELNRLANMIEEARSKNTEQ